MLTRPNAIRALCALTCIAALPTAGASAASTLPRVTSVAPMKLGIGDTLTIRGKNFRAGEARNAVIFKRDGHRALFVRAGAATRTRMTVRVPDALTSHLPRDRKRVGAARFRLRVLAGNFARRYTPLSDSPVIGPANVASRQGSQATGKPAAAAAGAPGASGAAALIPVVPPPPVVPPDCDGDGTPDATDGDDDGDLLTDTLEAAIGTAPCRPDTDGDGASDAFEYQSAIDLNSGAGSLPYPSKRPYPNPLFADAGTDYDGDGLSAGQEHALWRYAGPSSLPLSYSAGLKRTTGPADDDVRDADSDALGNWDELNGAMVSEWWDAITKEVPYTESYSGTSAVDPDSDGDGLADGADDQDFDGWANVDELSRDVYRVQPFNPCLPDYTSRTCSKHPPIEGSYPPFDVPGPLPAPPLQTGP